MRPGCPLWGVKNGSRGPNAACLLYSNEETSLREGAKSEQCPSPEVSRCIDHFVGAFFLDNASCLHEQDASAVLVIIQPQYGTDRDTIAFSGIGFLD